MTTAILKLQKKVHVGISSVDLPIINWKAIIFVGLLAGVVSIIFYAIQVNSLMGGSYLIGTYEKKIEKLTQENRDLQVSFAESDFMGQALAKAQKLDFEKTTSVKYVQILDNSFAVAK